MIARVVERNPSCRVVLVAYADWKRARAPAPEEVCASACDLPAGAFLLDTWEKDGRTLLNWLEVDEVDRLCQRCYAANVPVALAGSLGEAEIRTLLPARPNWFAVRGAACAGRDRSATVEEGRVRDLVTLVGGPDRPSQRSGWA
jgi:uncharacterized protein (UPF0264 family)